MAIVSVILFMILSVGLTILVTENIEFIVVDTLNKDLTLTGRTDFWPKSSVKSTNVRYLVMASLGFGNRGEEQLTPLVTYCSQNPVSSTPFS
jgi:hypothetical protein